MSKRCPPGVICIENITILLILIFIAAAILYLRSQSQSVEKQNITPITERVIIKKPHSGIFPRPSYSFTNIPSDVLMNPYAAPLRNDNYFPGSSGDPRGVPINIQTSSIDTAYRQIGILTRENGSEMILPLMGRPLFRNRDKWNFYTMSDKNNMIKLPISYKGKSCTNEYGCDNLYNGDVVYVEGYDGTFKVTVYDNQQMQYIPFV
jgi:hypothetical protein